MTTLDLESRARDSATTGFTLNNALGEALGAASVCWTTRVVHEGKYGRPDVTERVFDSERALAILEDLRRAVAKFTEIAINQQSIDAMYGAADWEIAELIFQAPAMGYEE